MAKHKNNKKQSKTDHDDLGSYGILAQYWRLISGCWTYAGDERKRVVQYYVMFILANAIFMTQPYVLGELINALQAGGDEILKQSLFWLTLYVLGTFGFWLFHGPGRCIERMTAYTIKKNFNLKFYDYITRLPLHWHHDHHSGATINRVNKAANALSGFAETQFIYLQSIVRFTGVFVGLAFIDVYVSLALFVISCLIFYLLTYFDKIIMRLNHRINEREHVFSAALFDYVSNIQNVIMFNLSQTTEKHLSGAIQSWWAPFARAVVLVEWKWFLMSMLIVLSHFLVLYLYIAHHMKIGAGEVLALGTVVAIFQYMLRLDGVFAAVAQKYADLVQTHTNVYAVGNIVKSFEDIGIRDDHLPVLKVKKGEIHYDHISFAYKKAAAVFSGFDLNIGARQKIGIIGRSGAGKSTLVNLLLRFYEAPDCRITIDGQDIREISTKSLREHIAVIPQDTTLFEDTLMENIRFGKLDATDKDVIAAAKKANCHDFIMETTEGYNSMVGERGVKLSGGQRQRIAIARAILKAAPILVLDEATSALDTESEQLIQESLEKLMEGRTVIAIAHRLSTIAHMDRLVVLDAGKIAEDGTHRSLLKKDGLYAQLWKKQSGGFITIEQPEEDAAPKKKAKKKRAGKK
ncbi:MAG: ABC transporter ATP-binding protein [Pseudomonadota bacterium]|nr:ABC transporter ATP-binding protein [Pseudomonadota bacterium]QKK04508.1 MAG: ABC transporter ATP-binding protein [Pseudomonadota bacterium]